MKAVHLCSLCGRVYDNEKKHYASLLGVISMNDIRYEMTCVSATVILKDLLPSDKQCDWKP